MLIVRKGPTSHLPLHDDDNDTLLAYGEIGYEGGLGEVASAAVIG